MPTAPPCRLGGCQTVKLNPECGNHCRLGGGPRVRCHVTRGRFCGQIQWVCPHKCPATIRVQDRISHGDAYVDENPSHTHKSVPWRGRKGSEVRVSHRGGADTIRSGYARSVLQRRRGSQDSFRVPRIQGPPGGSHRPCGERRGCHRTHAHGGWEVAVLSDPGSSA